MLNPFKDAKENNTGGPPFILELRREGLRPDGGFTPSAAVCVTDALRTSGLARQMDPVDFQTLLLVLSCVTANGTFVASAEILAQGMGASAHRMAGRLKRLTGLHWREGPLVFNHRLESGLSLFVPSAHLFEVRKAELTAVDGSDPQTTSSGEYEASVFNALQARRDAVVAHSRATYGRPRAEVEAQIERFLRNEPEPTTPEEAARLLLRRRIIAVGLTWEQADRLLDGFPASEIEEQIDWLPLRRARNPAGFLLAAMEGHYEPPPAVRQAAPTDEGRAELAEQSDITGEMSLAIPELLKPPDESEDSV